MFQSFIVMDTKKDAIATDAEESVLIYEAKLKKLLAIKYLTGNSLLSCNLHKKN